MGPRSVSIRLSKGALTGEGARRSHALGSAAGEQDTRAAEEMVAGPTSGGWDTIWRRI
jgi:hypothetical protein